MSRKSYTMREMKDIVKYIVHNNAYAETKGRQLWQKYAATNKTNRTWQSLKETFLKRILTDIANPYYELTLEQIDSFRSGSSLNTRFYNNLEWHVNDSEAGPSNESKNYDKDEKRQDPSDEVGESTFQEGELGDSQVYRDGREDSNSRDTLLLHSNDEGKQKENENDNSSVKTLILDENNQHSSRESGRISKLKDKLVFLEPLTPMMQEMISDSDISSSSDFLQNLSQGNEETQEKDGSLKEDKENEKTENMNVMKNKDISDKGSSKLNVEKVGCEIELKKGDCIMEKKGDCNNRNNDKTTIKSDMINDKLKDKVNKKIPSEMQTSNPTSGEDDKNNFNARKDENDSNHLTEIEKDSIGHEIKSTTKLVNCQSKFIPVNNESGNAIVDINEIITVQTSTQLESTRAKVQESNIANNGNEIPSFSLKNTSLYLKSSSDSLHSSDDVEPSQATHTVRKAERSKSKGLSKVFGFVSGERNLKFVTSKKNNKKESSKTKPKDSIRNNSPILSSWDSDTNSSSESDREYPLNKLRQIIQPLEMKAHVTNGILMAICGNHMYPVIKQVGSKQHYVKWNEDGISKMNIAKKCKESKKNHKYLTSRCDYENNNYSIELSSSSESNTVGKPFHKTRRYSTEKMMSKCKCRNERCSTPSHKWKNELMLEKQKNEKLMRLLDNLLELKGQKSPVGNARALKAKITSQSTTPDLLEPAQIDLTHEDLPTTTNQDNILRISASYGDKAIQIEVKDNHIKNPLQKILEALEYDNRNEADTMQENEQARHESKEVQARVDKLEETIFSTIVELDKCDENATPVNEEMQDEHNKTEANLSTGTRPVVSVTEEKDSTNTKDVIVDSPKHSPKKRKVTVTQKLKSSPRHRNKDTLNVPIQNESETTTVSVSTVEENKSKIIESSAQETHIPTNPKIRDKKKNKRSRLDAGTSIVDNDINKNVPMEENDVNKSNSMEVTENTPQVNSNDITFDDSDQEIVFSKENVGKRSSVESKSPKKVKKNRSSKEDTSTNVKPEEANNVLPETRRTRSKERKEEPNESNRRLGHTRSQNKHITKKKAIPILQDMISSIDNARFMSPESAYDYIDSDLSPVLQYSLNRQKCKRKYKVTKKRLIPGKLLPKSSRRLRQSNKFKKQLVSKFSNYPTPKNANMSANSTPYHTTPIVKSRVKNRRVMENIPIVNINQLPSNQSVELHSTSITETVASSDCGKNLYFENTPNSTGNLTPRGQDTPRSTYPERPVSPEISFIEKITIEEKDILSILSPKCNDLLSGLDNLQRKTLVSESHPLLYQDITGHESEQVMKHNENVDDSYIQCSQHSEELSLQGSRGYASLVSESLISGISNVNLSNKLQLSQTLETEFTNLSLEKQLNKLGLDSQPLKEKQLLKNNTNVTKSNANKSTKKTNLRSSKMKECDEITGSICYDSNDENMSNSNKGKRSKKQYVKVKIVRPKHKSKSTIKINNTSGSLQGDNKSSQTLTVPSNNLGDLSIEEIVTDPQLVISLDNDDSLLTPANPSLKLILGAEEDHSANIMMNIQSEDILSNDELTLSPLQETPSKWYLLSDDESLDAHTYRNRSCRGSLFSMSIPTFLSARRDLDLTAITEDSNDNNVHN